MDFFLGESRVGVWSASGAVAWAGRLEDVPLQSERISSRGANHWSRVWRKPEVRVWLAGSLARPFVVTPVAGLRGWTEAMRAAGSGVKQATGFDAPVRMWLDAMPARQAALGVAVLESTLAAVNDWAQRRGAAIASIRPWWAKALELGGAAGGGCDIAAVDDGESMVMLVTERDAWREASAYFDDGQTNDARLARDEATVQRRATALQIPAQRIVRLQYEFTSTPIGTGVRRVDRFVSP